MDEADRALLARYVDAFEQFDIDALVALLHEEATLSMPPYELWLRGRSDLRSWFLGTGKHCRGSRLLPVMANGSAAFAQYRPSGPGGSYEAWALQVVEISGNRIVAINSFLDTARLFPLFGRPLSHEQDATNPQDVGQADEREQLIELAGGATQPDLAPQTARGEL
jgi:RNA polymerase sigma-70 factor (ECF subfamily)